MKTARQQLLTQSFEIIGNDPDRETLDQLRAIHGKELKFSVLRPTDRNLNFRDEFKKFVRKSVHTVYVSAGMVSQEDIMRAKMSGEIFGLIKTNAHGKRVIHWLNVMPTRSACTLQDMISLKATNQLTIAMS